jgi:phage host-nuclease inhibitor protein Gam
MTEIYELEDIQENEKQEFIIDTPLKADWAVKVIKQEQAENQRLQSVIDDEIELLKLKKQRIADSLENKIGYLQGKLFEYFQTVEARELKTCYKYKLPSGELVYNKETVKYERDDEKIIQWLTDNNKMEFIKVKPSIDWSELKKTDFIENIDGVTKLSIPERFEVK